MREALRKSQASFTIWAVLKEFAKFHFSYQRSSTANVSQYYK